MKHTWVNVVDISCHYAVNSSMCSDDNLLISLFNGPITLWNNLKIIGEILRSLLFDYISG